MLINSKGARAALQWGNLTIPPWGTISNGTNRHPGVLAGGPEKTVTSMRILPKMHPLKLQKNTQETPTPQAPRTEAQKPRALPPPAQGAPLPAGSSQKRRIQGWDRTCRQLVTSESKDTMECQASLTGTQKAHPGTLRAQTRWTPTHRPH